jgi:glycosyltransferase involved in cell wall biosynthesis
MATAEAMGFGLPVVVADSGASPELIEDGVSGRLVKAADPRDLAATLVAMLSDLPGTAAMGLAARQRAGGRYSMPATAEATLALYAELLPTAGER